MQKLNLPTYPIKLKKDQSKTLVFDPIRKKYIVNTPEEWVRQNFIQFLIQEKGYPASLMAVEKGIEVANTKKRCDIVLYNNKGIPNIIVECKAPSINISQDAFDQIARYNMTLKTDLLIVTNGMQHYTCIMDHENQRYQFLKEIPNY
ncbi:MAG: type I restriction enzyme HsdR N-terminal domain-containing protein [Flavobacteriales bacterium]|nr:type I restriction enzyme HsdR N-terminal domain-containing protein [Flavobacteriales bacterium]